MKAFDLQLLMNYVLYVVLINNKILIVTVSFQILSGLFTVKCWRMQRNMLYQIRHTKRFKCGFAEAALH